MSTTKNRIIKENERTIGHIDALSLPLGIITVLGTVITYYISNFDFNYSNFQEGLFLAIMCFRVVYLLIAVAYLWSAFHITGVNHKLTYDYLPPLNIQEEFRKGLVKFYAADEYKDDNRDALVKKDFSKYVEDTYIQDAANNSRVNNECAKFIFKGKQNILRCMVSLVLALPVFGLNYALKPEKPTLIEIKKDVISQPDSIKNKKKVDMSKTNNTPPPSLTPPPQVNSQGVTYPARPESIHVKNGEVINPYPKVIPKGK